jgi:hypothetical protein
MIEALESALQYAGRNWPVLPCREKVPLVGGGVHAATRDLATIERWWHTRGRRPMSQSRAGHRAALS